MFGKIVKSGGEVNHGTFPPDIYCIFDDLKHIIVGFSCPSSTEFQLVISVFHEQLIPHALLDLIYVMFARLSSVADSEPVANYKHG